MLKRRFFLPMAALAATFAIGGAMAATTVTVTPADIGSGWYSADTRAPGTGIFENGPATPPLGTGSFEMTTLTNPEKVQLFTDVYDGVALADIDGIGYSTYRDPASTGFVAGVSALNLRIDLTGDGNPDAYMVYEPYQDQGNAAVLTGEWQDWDAYAGGAALWWINTGAAGCGQATPCTWADIVDLLNPTIAESALGCGAINPCPGSLGVNLGSFNSGIISNVDALYVSVACEVTTYDFELTPPPAPPASAEECKSGGWATLTVPHEFKNQGDCVSYTKTGK